MGFEPGTFRYWSQRLNPLRHTPQREPGALNLDNQRLRVKQLQNIEIKQTNLATYNIQILQPWTIVPKKFTSHMVEFHLW